MRILLLVLAAAALSSPHTAADQTLNLPPHYTAGSYIRAEVGGENFNTLLISLWDATTGKNYTTRQVGPTNNPLTLGPSTFILPTERLFFFHIFDQQGATTLHFYDYAPKSAPVPSHRYPSCVLPPSANQPTQIILNSTVYVINEFNVSVVTLPRTGGGMCQVSPPMQMSYGSAGPFYPEMAKSLLPDSFIFTNGAGFAVLKSTGGRLSVTVHQTPSDMDAIQWIQADPVTGDLYSSIEHSHSDRHDLWRGKASASTGTFDWAPMAYWVDHYIDAFSLDTRNETAYAGPLFCNSYGCRDAFTQQVWISPPLNTVLDGSGFEGERWYDAACH